MTVTTAETLSVNGTVLNTLAYNIESLTGRLAVPQLRTENVAVPGRHGRLRTANKYHDEAVIVLPMWVRGCDANGLVTSGRQQFMANVDMLTRLFRPGSGLLEVLHTLPDGTIRRAWAECTEVIDFSVQGGGMPLGKFSVALKVPSVFWEDDALRMVDLLPSHNGPVAIMDGTTGPVEDSVITIVGPATNPRIEALYSGDPLENPSWFQYSGTIGAGKTLIVNCGNWTLTGTGGLTVDYSLFTHAGGARWLTIVPAPIGQVPGLRITASSTTGATKVNLSARRKYLVG